MGELRSLSNDSFRRRPHSGERVRRHEEDTWKDLTYESSQKVKIADAFICRLERDQRKEEKRSEVAKDMGMAWPRRSTREAQSQHWVHFSTAISRHTCRHCHTRSLGKGKTKRQRPSISHRVGSADLASQRGAWMIAQSHE